MYFRLDATLTCCIKPLVCWVLASAASALSLFSWDTTHSFHSLVSLLPLRSLFHLSGVYGYCGPICVSLSLTVYIGIAFVLIYKFVPNEKIKWKYVWPGTIFGIVFFDAAKSLFVLYLANFANYEMIYGSIASVIIFLVWIYYSAIILIVGAELNSEYA